MAKRRPSGDGMVRKKEDGSWEGRVVIGYDEKNLPKTKNVLAKTKSECVEKLKQLQEQYAPPKSDKIKLEMPFGEWMDFWYQTYIKSGLRPATQNTYESTIYQHIIPQLGKIPLCQLTQKDLQQFYAHLKKEGRLVRTEQFGKGLSDRMVRMCHAKCRAALDQAMQENLIRTNPAVGCKLPPKRSPEMQVLSLQELQLLNELPDLKGREAILKVHGKKVKVDESVDYNEIARATNGASGAELANIINEAAIAAVKDNRKVVYQRDMEEAIETVIAGYQRKNAVVSPRDKLTVSYHECGHALVAAKLKNSAPVQKITIIPRTSGALGYTMQVDEEERLLMTREQILDKITTFCGGRAAEQLIFGRITSGASNDIEQATKLARAMITRLGMSDTFGMMALETQSGQYLSGDSNLVCSDQTAARIDVEVKQIIANCYEQAYQILSDNKEKLHETAKVLLEKETITGMEFMAILAPNQLPSAETEKAEEKPEEKPDDSADDVEVK